MNRYSRRFYSLISFVIIPIMFFWNPSWFSLMRITPYWPLFWILPWALLYGSLSAVIISFCIGIILDSLINDIYTQIPGLMICGFWFGTIGLSQKHVLKNYQYGLITSIGTFICGVFYFIQVLFNSTVDNSFSLLFPHAIKNIFAQIFLTGLFSPVFSSWLYLYFKKNMINKLSKRF